MDTSGLYQCGNINNIRYIIDHKEYDLLRTRNFSQEDSEEFLIYALPEQLKNLSKGNIESVLRYAQANPEVIREDMMDPLFEYDLSLDYEAAKIFATKDMEYHMEALLSKYGYTQDQYLELWHKSSKCKKIIAIYFDNEARNTLTEEYISKKSKYLREGIFGVTLMALILCGFVALGIAGIVLVSTNPNEVSNGEFMMGLTWIALSGIIIIFMLSALLPLNIYIIRAYLETLREYNQTLKHKLIMV